MQPRRLIFGVQGQKTHSKLLKSGRSGKLAQKNNKRFWCNQFIGRSLDSLKNTHIFIYSFFSFILWVKSYKAVISMSEMGIFSLYNCTLPPLCLFSSSTYYYYIMQLLLSCQWLSPFLCRLTDYMSLLSMTSFIN